MTNDSPATHATAGEVSRNFGQWQDVALTAPVIITHHGRPRVVLLSADRYASWNNLPMAAGSAEAHVAETSREALLEQMAEGFIALDPTLRVTKVNPVFEALAGRSAGQLVGSGWSDLFPLPTQAVIAEQMRRVLRTGEAVEFEADSTVQPGRCYGVRVFPYPGGVAALFANRTEEHSLRSRLRHAQAMQTATAALPRLAIARLNIRGVLAEMDEDFLRLTGFSSAELLDCRLTDIVRPSDRRALSQALEKVLQGGPAARVETTLLVRAGDERPVELSLAPVLHDGTADGVMVLILAEA
ncbi:type II toxin-antitoxin system prevent-host-death family antitoxin [Caulobacter sp. BK020]|uniref:type II toxin-antitoxin system prevent-host-death family antitoxin n=1 Tax=Caulobacter sp. BK020 TaxID=2512117 RepID=UPI001053187F|nr:type II toxin-antitoxin system prevent-host-death family antitoxin [Caulobacter sp. BK020]TCS16530.1 prevent-host-death family protein [Caulobacter sp. BK020]